MPMPLYVVVVEVQMSDGRREYTRSKPMRDIDAAREQGELARMGHKARVEPYEVVSVMKKTRKKKCPSCGLEPPCFCTLPPKP